MDDTLPAEAAAIDHPRVERFLLPLEGWPLVRFETDFSYDGGRLLLDGRPVMAVPDRAALEAGAEGRLRDGQVIRIRLVCEEGNEQLQIEADGELALPEKRLQAPPSRSAWVHAVIALLGSFAGFVAGYLYLLKAQHIESAWAMKMAYHTAGWHLLLTFTLFPASVWGQRLGIRSVQFMSLMFFCIHVGIAIANWSSPDSLHDGAIAWLNALSGMLFLASVLYGQRAYRDMDPVAALRSGRV